MGYLVGATLSGLAGYVGMLVSVQANVRTAEASRKGLSQGLSLAFKSGAVTGMLVAGLALLSIAIYYFFLLKINTEERELINALIALGFGASLISIFARLGGGIFTKGADVGADLVGKVEVGIPEDDPRNPAVIADNVGDNVGDVAGRGADLFESMTAENIGAMVIGVSLYSISGNISFIIFPLLARTVGIFGTLLGIPFLHSKDFTNPMIPMRNSMIATTLFTVVGLYLLVDNTILSLNLYYAAIVGVLASLAIFIITEYYTAEKYRPVKDISEFSIPLED